jgi:ParB family chromosome partitioning protein
MPILIDMEVSSMEYLTIEQIPIDSLVVSALNVRRQIGDLTDLAASIRAIGLLQPIVIRPASDGGFEVVAGRRRLEACRRLGWEIIPAIRRDLSDREALVLSLSENVQQDTLDPIERAEGVQWLVEDLSQEMSRSQAIEATARWIGKSTKTIYTWLALLRTTEAVRTMVLERKVETKVAARLASLPPERQEPVARVIAQEDLSRKDALRAVSYLEQHPEVPPKQAVAAFRSELLQEYNLTIALPGELYIPLARRAEQERCSIQEIIRRCVREYLGL